MYSKTEVVFYQYFNEAIAILESKLKCRKALILSGCEQDNILFKKKLFSRQIFCVEIFMLEQIPIKIEQICQLFNVNEDIRGVITFDERLIDVAKYISSIMNVPCFLFCANINFSLFNQIFIKNDKKFEKYVITNQVYIMMKEDKINEIQTLSDFSTASLCLLDLLSSNQIASTSCEYKRLKRYLTCAIVELKAEEYVKAEKNIVEFYTLMAQNYNFVSTHLMLALLAEQLLSNEEQICVCKFVFNAFLSAIKFKKTKVLPCDYSLNLTELVLKYGLDKLWLIKELRAQLKVLEGLNINVFLTEAKLLNKLLVDSIKSSKTYKVKPISKQLKQLLTHCKYLPLGINTMTLIREILCE